MSHSSSYLWKKLGNEIEETNFAPGVIQDNSLGEAETQSIKRQLFKLKVINMSM